MAINEVRCYADSMKIHLDHFPPILGIIVLGGTLLFGLWLLGAGWWVAVLAAWFCAIPFLPPRWR